MNTNTTELITYNNIDYKLNTREKRLERVINDDTVLVSIFFGNLYTEPDCDVFVLKNGVCIQSGRNINYDKKSTRAEYLKNQRPPILQHATPGSILAIRRDTLDLFENQKEYMLRTA